jgi:hypothetical protein
VGIRQLGWEEPERSSGASSVAHRATRLATGWRPYRAGDVDEDDREAEILMFCPDCTEREFGPFGCEPEGQGRRA